MILENIDFILASVFVVWFVLFGACIGSFLNVVVYRLPLGKSLSDPPSHCPKCGHRIRPYDNVPVLGWIWLGGKCRDCREPISARYPIVEALVTAVFGSLAFMTLRRQGDASLGEFICLVLALSCLVATLLAAGLIEVDSRRIPWKLYLPALFLAPMVPYLIQESFGIPAYVGLLYHYQPVHLVEIVKILPAMAGSAGSGLLTVWICRSENRTSWMLGTVLLGVYGGFGASLIPPVVAILFLLFRKTPLRYLAKPHVLLAMTTFALLLALLSWPMPVPPPDFYTVAGAH